jgi:hypothetical protein
MLFRQCRFDNKSSAEGSLILKIVSLISGLFSKFNWQ